MFSHCPSSNQSRRIAASPSSVMGPIHWGGPQATRSFVQGCSTAMAPHPVGRDAQVSGPSMHAAATSMARGQRRMVGRSSSMTERLWSAAQAVQTTTVNGRSVARRGEVNVFCRGRSRGDLRRVMPSCQPLISPDILKHNMFEWSGGLSGVCRLGRTTSPLRLLATLSAPRGNRHGGGSLGPTSAAPAGPGRCAGSCG